MKSPLKHQLWPHQILIKIMNNIFFMPKEFDTLDKNELVNAFFGTYYELIIALEEDSMTSEIVEYIRTSVKQIEESNELLWKHMWLSFSTFLMHRMKYLYCCECIKREKTRLAETHDVDFIRFMAMLNVASKELTRKDAIFEAPRFTCVLYGDDSYQQCRDALNKYQKQLHVVIDEHISLINFKCNYLNTVPYMDRYEFVLDALTMLQMGLGNTPEIIEACLGSVLKISNKDEFMGFCTQLYNIIKEV